MASRERGGKGGGGRGHDISSFCCREVLCEMILLPLLSVMQHSVNWSWETISDVRTAGLFYDIDEAFATSHPAVVAAVRLFAASQYPANGAEIAVMCVHRCMLKDGTVLRGAQYRNGKGMRKDCYVEVAPNEDAPVLWHGKVETFVAVTLRVISHLRPREVYRDSSLTSPRPSAFAGLYLAKWQDAEGNPVVAPKAETTASSRSVATS